MNHEIAAEERSNELSSRTGFRTSLGFNLLVAMLSWASGVYAYGYGNYGGLSYHFEVWLIPVAVAAAGSALTGLLLLWSPRRRRFGTGVLTGTLLAAFAEFCWMCLYFVSLGS